MDFDSDNHTFMFRFHSAEGERDLEMNCNALFLDDILDQFRDFLQGCGYIIDGRIEVVPYDAPQYVVNDKVSESYQANFDFSNIPNNNWPFAQNKNGDEVYSPVVPTSEK